MSGTIVTEQDYWLFCRTWELSITLDHWEEYLLHISLEEFGSDIGRIAGKDLQHLL
jgi:hypothetical protein